MGFSEQFLPKMQGQFAAVVPIAVCNNNSNPYVEQTYTYPVRCFFPPRLFFRFLFS